MYYSKKKLNKAISKIDWDNSTPKRHEILNALNIKKIVVVILGQDPYPKKNVANGNAFAVNIESKIPQSLRNIFKEIKLVNGVVHTDRTLNSWKEQGVLLLNTSLTTSINKSNTHRNIWQDFVTDLIKNISTDDSIIWVLWGRIAQGYKKYIKKYREIIEDAHPSPLSVRHRKQHTFKILKETTKIKW